VVYSSFLSPASFWLPDHDTTSPWARHAPFAFWLVDALRPGVLVQAGQPCAFAEKTFCQAVARLALTTQCFAGPSLTGGPAAFDDGSVDLLHLAGWLDEARGDERPDFDAWRRKLSSCAIVLLDHTQNSNAKQSQNGLWRELSRQHPHFEFPAGSGLGVIAYGRALPDRARRFFEAAADAATADNIRAVYARLGNTLEQAEDERDGSRRSDTAGTANEVSSIGAPETVVPIGLPSTEVLSARAPESNWASKIEQDHLREQLTLALMRIAHIENVLDRRIGNRLRTMVAQALILFRAQAFLAPLNHVSLLRLTKSTSEWEMHGNDPSFILGLGRSGPLGPGHYELRFTEVDPGDLVGPVLYVDSGAGFNEAEALPLRLTPTSGRAVSATVLLPSGARQLRLDPASQPGKLSMGSVYIRRLLRTEYYMRTIAKLLRQRVKRPADAVRYMRLATKIVAERGVLGLAQALRDTQHAAERRSPELYQDWIRLNDTLTDGDIAALRKRVKALREPPLISVVMPVYNTPETLLREAIDSVRAQIYDKWELCIADDCSPKPHVREILEAYAKDDARIKVTFREENGHISAATNSAFELASGSWIAMMDHDDILRPNALAEVALEIAKHPDTELIYSDEDKLDSDGKRFDPYFKPDFSRELFRSQNYLNHLTVHRAANIRAAGGWRKGFEGSQDYDLNLRIFERIDPAKIRHIPKVLYHWRAVAGSTAVAGSEKGYAFDAGLKALKEHVTRTGLKATAEPAPDTPFYRLRLDVPDPAPLVSLIIPTRDKLELLRGCISSIRDKTTYANYEIIVVDNGSVETETLAYLTELDAEPWGRVLRYDKPFNYSAINNFAAERANGSILGLVNNDIEVISPDWLSEMVSWAAQPDVGCVGAKLYYGNDTIQHAGVILGIGGVAGHSHKYFPRDHPGYFSRLKVLQNLSAVTAACLLVRKDVFQQLGGLNERDLTVAFNDVDFCLKARQAGYLNVWTPYAELYHLESVSRGHEDNPEKQARFAAETKYMRSQWDLDSDPYYSMHLTRDHEDFSIGQSKF
jgi:glycosyltransferase involved in cell wall biosynthesis